MKSKDNHQQEEAIKDYLHADMDDIIYEHRNKAYGGYLLRKLYPGNLTKANIIATVLFILLISLPVIAKMIKDKLPQDEETLAVEVTLAEPPLRKPTIAFVAPKVKKDEEVQKEAPPPDVDQLKAVDISTKTQEGVENGVPEGLTEEEAPPRS